MMWCASTVIHVLVLLPFLCAVQHNKHVGFGQQPENQKYPVNKKPNNVYGKPNYVYNEPNYIYKPKYVYNTQNFVFNQPVFVVRPFVNRLVNPFFPMMRPVIKKPVVLRACKLNTLDVLYTVCPQTCCTSGLYTNGCCMRSSTYSGQTVRTCMCNPVISCGKITIPSMNMESTTSKTTKTTANGTTTTGEGTVKLTTAAKMTTTGATTTTTGATTTTTRGTRTTAGKTTSPRMTTTFKAMTTTPFPDTTVRTSPTTTTGTTTTTTTTRETTRTTTGITTSPGMTTLIKAMTTTPYHDCSVCRYFSPLDRVYFKECEYSGLAEAYFGNQHCTLVFTSATVDGVLKNTFLTHQFCTNAMMRMMNSDAYYWIDLYIGTLYIPINNDIFYITNGTDSAAFLTVQDSRVDILSELASCKTSACGYDKETMDGLVDLTDCKVVDPYQSYREEYDEIYTVAVKISPDRCGSIPDDYKTTNSMCFTFAERELSMPRVCADHPNFGVPVFCKAPSNGHEILMGIVGSPRTCTSGDILVVPYPG